MKTNILTEAEIQQLRGETRGTAGRIHFNNAGASLPPDIVVDTVISYLQEEALSGGYETEAKYKQQLDNTYQSIASLINAEVDEIATVESASEAWTLAFNGVGLKKGDVVLTCEMEYVTNIIAFIHANKTCGVEVQIIPNDEQGNFSLQALEAAISPQVRLIAMTHIPSTAGGMIPIVEIGKIARENNILYLVDACQSAGQVPLDVKLIGCDMLSVTGRKYLRAPRGTGFLFVRKDVQYTLKLIFVDGFTAKTVTLNDYQVRDDARRFELYEKNRALTLGLGKAVDYALNIGVDRIWQRIQYLADAMRRKLSEMDGITLHDSGEQQCGIVTFSVEGMESAEVKAKLAERKISVSVGLAKSTLYYMSKNHLTSVVRASVHYYNTDEEIMAFCNAMLLIKNLYLQ
jgi:cysteine desulfurase/selenocysteine lyase